VRDGQAIWVRDSEEGEWVPRHFARLAQGGIYCYQYGKSKHSSMVRGGDVTHCHWRHFRTTDPDESTTEK